MHLGIDVDSDWVRAAYLSPNGSPALLPLAHGDLAWPAMARQTMHGLQLGPTVAETLAGNQETTLCSPSRLMGRAGDLPAHILRHLPFGVRPVDDELRCNLLYAEVRPSTVYGRLVKAMVDAAETRFNERVTGVVLSVPAGAEDRFRVQARQAVEAEGVPLLRLLNQPTAALLAAALPRRAQRVAVVHIGGGAIAVSLAEREFNAGQEPDIRILATAGDNALGGDDLVWSITEKLNERLKTQAGLDVFQTGESRLAAFGLRRAAETMLARLSNAPQTSEVLDHGGGFGRDLVLSLSRAELDEWAQTFCNRVETLCREALKRSRTGRRGRRKPVDVVLLTGSWSTYPPIAEAIARAFERPVAALHQHQAALLPVFGAALVAANPGRNIWDVTPYPLGINCYYGDEERFSPIIDANTPIPTPDIGEKGSFVGRYQTRYRNQTSVSLDILQYRGLKKPGPERVFPNECEQLGHWNFSDLSPRRGQHADFTVTFAIDADGILHLQAHETDTGHSLSAQVERRIG